MDTYNLSSYIHLIKSFLTGDLTALDFESKYLDTFKSDPTLRPQEVFLVLDKLFGDVDAFCAEPNLRDEDDLDEDQLRQYSVDALQKLKSFTSR